MASKKASKKYDIPVDSGGSTKVCLRFPNDVLAILNSFCNEHNKCRQHMLNAAIRKTMGGAK